ASRCSSSHRGRQVWSRSGSAPAERLRSAPARRKTPANRHPSGRRATFRGPTQGRTKPIRLGGTMAAEGTPAAVLDDVEDTVGDDEASLAVRRYFTIPGRDPFDEIEWERRDAFIPGKDKPVFEQKGVEFPKFWSQTATNIVAQKYFRGRMGSPERESSVRQMVGRVVTTIGRWGRDGGYFADEEEAETFETELKAILVNQLAAFNSPVWFNVGFEEKPQCSACQPYDALISTPDGMVPIGELVGRN